MNNRIEGFDVARALAIFGMIIVNFKIVMGTDHGNTALMTFSSLFEGRASALFVILAGMGITFLTKNKQHRSSHLEKLRVQVSLFKRAILLIGLGYLFTLIWPADILHFYGFYFFIGLISINLSDKNLLRLTIAIILTFPLLMGVVDYEYGWNWETLSYQNFWTLDGILRHQFFNGFHPVFPWSAFLVFGMWLARQNLLERATQKSIFTTSLLTLVVIESAFYGLRVFAIDNSEIGLLKEEVIFLFSTAIIPPLPQYMISAICSSMLIIIACVYIYQKNQQSHLLKYLAKTGQLSLSIYIAHVIVGMGIIEYLGLFDTSSIEVALLSAFGFCIASIVFSNTWLTFFKSGPFEMLFKKAVS